MPLPIVTTPTFEIKVPSTGKTIKVRPFLVKEEKILLIAAESKSKEDIIESTKEVIKNCILEGDFNVDTAPFFDLDYLFIALRAKSIGETVKLNFICKNIVDTNNTNNNIECNGEFQVNLDITNCEVENTTNNKKISLTDDIAIKMKYPTYTIMKRVYEQLNDIEKKIRLIASCIDFIQEKDQVNSAKDYSTDELINFVENLTEENFRKLETFVDNLPSFFVSGNGKCKKCGFEHTVRYKNFESFFQ